jgi:catecholate siderophore receptor
VSFGSGSAGGVVNVVSRVPHLGNSLDVAVTGGMGPFIRGTADANYQIGDTTAVRLNVMGQDATIVGRDLPRGQRFGFAPSVAFGLGTDTTLTLEYMYYRYDEPTDAGVPIVARPGSSIATPVTESGVRREAWYGSNSTDRDESTVNRLTARLQHRANDWLTIYNDTRVGIQDRKFSYSIISCDATCAGRLFNGGGVPLYSFSGAGSPYDSQTWGAQNITTAVARFNTGSLRHEATLGADVWYEDFERIGYSYGADRAAFRGNLLSPDNGRDFAYSRSTAANATRRSETTQGALFASDRIWLTPEVSVLAGLRWTRQQTDYQAFGPGQPVTELSADNSFVDPRAAIIWEPTPNNTLYFSYARSTFAPGSNWTTQPGQASANNSALEPEENTIYELGGRTTLLGGSLGLSASIYQIEKNNATERDPASGTVFSSGDKQRIRGLDLGATG